jgi:pSer/pThr/pTyr-binding forkhead associated (FHA) protein
VTSLLVILLVVAASAALIAQVVWWLSGRPEQTRVPPPLVVPIHPRFARAPEPPAPEPPPELPAPEPPPPEPPLAETMQFVRPTDEALQLLPARLEVVSGTAPQQVLRFVRVPGKPAEMILGRETASSPQQVTLTSSTVSRRHARVTCTDGRWVVTNLSRTNPVVINDEALYEFEGARPLLDGDRIELGDVVLRFCTS